MKKTMRAPMNGPSKSTNKNVEMVNEKTRTPCGLCRRDELSEAMYIV